MDHSGGFPEEEIEKVEVWQPSYPDCPDEQPRQASLHIKLILRHRYIRLTPPGDAVLEGVVHHPRRLETALDMSVFKDYDASYRRLRSDLYLLGVPCTLHREVVDELFRHGQRAAASRGRRMSASIEIRFNNVYSGGSQGMVPALLKRGRVEEADRDHDSVGESKRRRHHVALPDKSCSICWEDYEAGSTVVRMPCLHVFHEHCSLRRLNKSHYCPLCRFQMPTTNIATCKFTTF